MTALAMAARPAAYSRNSLGIWSLVLGIASVVLVVVRFLAGGSDS